MTPEAMAGLHARAYDGQGRAWSTQEFHDLMTSPHVFATGDETAFALGRVIADEAEILTIATRPDLRRQGLGRRCLEAFEAEAAARGATRSFLEVAQDNAAALGLYLAQGYLQTGQRHGYYARPGAHPVDALILSKTLIQ